MYNEIINQTELSFDFFGNVKVIKQHPSISLVGVGKTAAVFHINDTDKVIKIFHRFFSDFGREEAKVYKKLIGLQHFPTLHEHGYRFLVLDYVKGTTLFDYLVKGYEIEDYLLDEVDKSLKTASDRGLNPSDVHLKNIVVTDNGLKIIDVAQFRNHYPCLKWKHLKEGYRKIYKKRFFPKKIPKIIIELFAISYRKFHYNKKPIL